MDWTLVKSINSMSQQGILWATSSRAAENYAEVLKRITTRVVEVINFISNTCALHSPGYVDMESMAETMMQQLLSKAIFHEPMNEIGERYHHTENGWSTINLL